jgi:hypothetical protein
MVASNVPEIDLDTLSNKKTDDFAEGTSEPASKPAE